MRVAVIRPYVNEPEAWLTACRESVQAQTHAATHILVADGSPRDYVAALQAWITGGAWRPNDPVSPTIGVNIGPETPRR